MAQITINEGLAWLKTLKKRHEELLALCRRFSGASADKESSKNLRRSSGGAHEPVANSRVLDAEVLRRSLAPQHLGKN
jgi:hypothetical protein